MATSFRFGGYAVRREFRKGFSFCGSLPPRDAPTRDPAFYMGRKMSHSGGNSSPHRRYRQYSLLYRVARPSYQGGYRRSDWNDWDTARFMPIRQRLKGWKQLINRAYRRSWRQQVHCGLESPSEFRMPGSVNYLNVSD